MPPDDMLRTAAPTAVAAGRSTGEAPVSLARILVALDASDHAERGLAEAIRLTATADGAITGIHAYAAKMHDRRFRQMEGGLPQRYREEEEMAYQRDVHDDLITRGLDIISDSYHDAAQRTCDAAGIAYRRLSPEGKNYRRVVEAVESGDFDVLVLGALGLGAVPGSVVGTVCERVVRRSPIDSLVVRDIARAIGDGPVVVGLDGSAKSFGALATGIDIGRRLAAPIHVVAAYDPYYHYVAFNKIAGVLSDAAGKVFRFKQQEALHEELIDAGIAKIYQSHLDVARRLAAEMGVTLVCKLLDGKPFRAVADYLAEVGASLLVVGKTGVHADSGLDIGGNAENLLRLAPCHLWLGQTTSTPPIELVAEASISWSTEAEAFLAKAPEFARGMARSAVIRHAHENGHSFITKALVVEVARQLMPASCPVSPGGAAKRKARNLPIPWRREAEKLLATVPEDARQGIRLRAEKKARRAAAAAVTAAHVAAFLGAQAAAPMRWAAAGLARLAKVPEPVRDDARARIEAVVRGRGDTEVTLETAEAGFAECRQAMHEAMRAGGHKRTADQVD